MHGVFLCGFLWFVCIRVCLYVKWDEERCVLYRGHVYVWGSCVFTWDFIVVCS